MILTNHIKLSMPLPRLILIVIVLILESCTQSGGQEHIYTPTLADHLRRIMEEDQRYRVRADSAWREHNQSLADSLFRLQTKLDQKNLAFITRMLDSAGISAFENTGPDGLLTAWLTIQHGDTRTQEKYLPAFRKANKNGLLSSEHLALLEDRVLIGNDKHQRYGTQVARNARTDQDYVQPLENVDSVDVWRARMGMCPLRAYLMGYGINWNPGQYKKILPEIEKYWKEDRERLKIKN